MGAQTNMVAGGEGHVQPLVFKDSFVLDLPDDDGDQDAYDRGIGNDRDGRAMLPAAVEQVE